jgi:hypothetical protein
MGGANWTVFAVFKLASGVPDSCLYCESTAGTAMREVQTGSAKFQGIVRDGSSHVASPVDPTVLTASTAYVATFTSANGNPATAYVNGDTGTAASNASIGAYTPVNFVVGALDFSGGLSTFLSGDLLALIVYNNVLSSTDRAYVRDGLKTLYAAY